MAGLPHQQQEPAPKRPVVLSPTVTVELIWRDETGSQAATTFHAPTSTPIAEIDASASAVASILLSMTGCALMGQRIKYRRYPSAPAIAAADSPITNCGVLYMGGSLGLVMGLIEIPSLKPSVLLDTTCAAGLAIDTTNSDIQALVSAIVDNGITNVFGVPYTSLIAAYQQKRV